jgi:serine/threonine-protein kinase HipA
MGKSNCRCCSRAADGLASYHPACLRRLFDTEWLPSIPFGVDDFQAQVMHAVAASPMSISGVQKKASVLLNKKNKTLEIVSSGGTHILKPPTEQYPQIPELENLCMNMAERTDIKVPSHGLLPMKDGSLCYVVRRFDRLTDGTKTGQEDMKQILGVANKYQGSLEAVGKILLQHATYPGLEAVNFFERVIFCFLIGNGDMHLKNWSMTELKNGQKQLTPAYDLLSSTLYFPDESESALTVRGKNARLHRQDFEAFAEHLKIDPKAANTALQRLLGMQDLFQAMVQESNLISARKKTLSEILSGRFSRLSQ